jgi:hypothetical protein
MATTRVESGPIVATGGTISVSFSLDGERWQQLMEGAVVQVGEMEGGGARERSRGDESYLARMIADQAARAARDVPGGWLDGRYRAMAHDDAMDVFAKCTTAELHALHHDVAMGYIGGHSYETCILGRIAHMRGTTVDHPAFYNQFHPSSRRPLERFVLQIDPHDTPQTNPYSAVLLEWIEIALRQRGDEPRMYTMADLTRARANETQRLVDWYRERHARRSHPQMQWVHPAAPAIMRDEVISDQVTIGAFLVRDEMLPAEPCT